MSEANMAQNRYPKWNLHSHTISRLPGIAPYFNPLKPSGNYMYQLSFQLVTQCFVFMDFVWLSLYIAIISLNSINQLIFAMVKCGVLFEVRTEFLNNI
jgi:hypothetical protein